MSVIYSELIEDYFLTNINDDLFSDDNIEKEEDLNSSMPVTEFSIRNCPDCPVRCVMLEHSLSSSVDLVGLQLWRGALLLADFILAHPDIFKNRNILELAAGTGLTSVIAAIFGRQVTVTDVDRGDILDLIRRNFELNAKAVENCKWKVSELDFFWSDNDWPDNITEAGLDCDIILAADVVYDENITLNFFKTLKKLLSVSCKTAFIAIEKRQHAGNNGEIIAPNYKIFLEQMSLLHNAILNNNKIKVENISLSFDQYLKYSRVNELNLFKITSIKNE